MYGHLGNKHNKITPNISKIGIIIDLYFYTENE